MNMVFYTLYSPWMGHLGLSDTALLVNIMVLCVACQFDVHDRDRWQWWLLLVAWCLFPLFIDVEEEADAPILNFVTELDPSRTSPFSLIHVPCSRVFLGGDKTIKFIVLHLAD
jgi:hypothetical protein